MFDRLRWTCRTSTETPQNLEEVILMNTWCFRLAWTCVCVCVFSLTSGDAGKNRLVSCPSCSSLSPSKGSVSHKKSKKKKKHKHKDRDVRKCSACKCWDGVPKDSSSAVLFICRGMDMRMTTALCPAGSVAVWNGLYTPEHVHVIHNRAFVMLAELQTQRREQSLSLLQARPHGALTTSLAHRLQ